MEGLKVYEIIEENQPTTEFPLTFWERQVPSKLIPERAGEQLHKFWLKHCNMSIDQYLLKCLDEDTPFSLSIPEIPSRELPEPCKQEASPIFMEASPIQEQDVPEDITEEEQFSNEGRQVP
jgi:hypothetical protein